MKMTLISLIVLNLFARRSIAGQERPEFATEAEKLKAIQHLLTKRALKPTSTPEPKFCTRFLEDFIADMNIKAVEPDVRANSNDDPGLKIWHSCDRVSIDDMKISDPKDGYDGIHILPGPPYRYYRIILDGDPKGKKANLLYHEAVNDESGSYGSTEYTWVDLKGCGIRGGIGVTSMSLYQNAHPSSYLLNTIVSYKGVPFVLEISPNSKEASPGYYLGVTRFDRKKRPVLCSWIEQPKRQHSSSPK